VSDALRRTPIELAVRRALQARVAAVTFREQYRIGPYRADFYLPSFRLVIEADGAAWHTKPGQRARDARRDAYMRSRGYRVARLTGSEIRRDARSAVERALMKGAKPVKKWSGGTGYTTPGPAGGSAPLRSCSICGENTNSQVGGAPICGLCYKRWRDTVQEPVPPLEPTTEPRAVKSSGTNRAEPKRVAWAPPGAEV
jgi:very-short-patch-repair endonuclease